MIKGITSGNSNLGQAVQVFNTLNDLQTAQERSRGFDFGVFAEKSVQFGEEIVFAASHSPDALVRDSLQKAVRTLCIASLQLVDALKRGLSDIATAREIWSQAVTRSVQVLKEVLAIVAKRS